MKNIQQQVVRTQTKFITTKFLCGGCNNLHFFSLDRRNVDIFHRITTTWLKDLIEKSLVLDYSRKIQLSIHNVQFLLY